ncbi:MAG: hypothetical protein H5U40_12565, partial [Polyangiaceae bacterium]|nr:hypothetical protein [Polyangiaceae bacterium]
MPEGPHQANPALLRVAGVPVAVRLLTNALRAGAVDLRIEGHGEVTDSVRSALARDRRFVRARLGGADERVPTALPTIEARADVELPFSLLALLAREEGSVFVPGAPFVAKDRHLGDPRPLWASTPPSDGLLLPVRTEAEALDATRRIFLTLASRSASAVARRLNSPISTAISRLLVETPLSPTMATVGHTMV